MTYNPNSNWTTAAALAQQPTAYFLRIEGLSYDFSTHYIKAAGTTKKIYMEVPETIAPSVLDIINGTRNIQTVELEVKDINDEVTQLVATEGPSAPLGALANVKATLYGGYRSLAEADYAAIFTGRIRRVRMTPSLDGYIFTLRDLSHMLDGELMSSASQTRPASIAGNVVNVFWSCLTGTFSTTHSTYPLTSVSSSSGVASAPTGLGIDTGLINSTLFQSQRDTWRASDEVSIVFDDPVDARDFFEKEIFRNFQSFPTIAGDGTLGLRFVVPALPTMTPVTITEDDIISESWDRLFDKHLNKFTVLGDYDRFGNTYPTELYRIDTTEDTADRTATGETKEYLIESKLLRTSLDGIEIGRELAERMRAFFLKTPALLTLELPLTKRALEEGDIAQVTHSKIPDLFDGTKGISARNMLVLSVRPDFDRGRIQVELMDVGFKRFGLITAESQVDFGSASDSEKNSYFFISDDSGQMGDASDGYRFI